VGQVSESQRTRAQRVVNNWRVNFSGDDDEPLINMIEAYWQAEKQTFIDSLVATAPVMHFDNGYPVKAVPVAQLLDRPTKYGCHRCGHDYAWPGGISFAAVCDLGRRIREHYEAEHPGVEPNG
jgi:hypothetical protein